MKRDDAKKHFWTDTDDFGESVAKRFGDINYEKIFTGYYIGSEIDKFIDKIYDYFENRSCKSCKYFTSSLNTNKYDCCEKGITDTSISFCCNKWEVKK